MFSDQECTHPKVKVEVVHKETEQEAKDRLYEKDLATIKQLMLSNQFEEAERYAKVHSMSDVYEELYQIYLKWKAEEKHRIAKEQERQREQQVKEALDRQQQAIVQQQEYIVNQQERLRESEALLSQQQLKINQQRNQIQSQEVQMQSQEAQIQSSSHPQYVPSMGQWCQRVAGGVLNCWK